MAVDLKLPLLGDVMVEGTLASWLKEDGAHVQRGEPLYQLETDKVNYAVEAPASGVLRHLVSAGETVAVGTVVGQVLDSARGADQGVTRAGVAGASSETGRSATTAAAERGRSAAAALEREVRASPAARRLARQLGVDIESMGATRRVRSADVEAFAAAGASSTTTTRLGSNSDLMATPAARRLARHLDVDLAPLAEGRLLRTFDVQAASTRASQASVATTTSGAVERGAISNGTSQAAAPRGGEGAEARQAKTVELSGRRRIIAERMLGSLQSMAQLTVSLEVDFTAALQVRTQLGQLWGAESRPTITDLVIRAAVLALGEHPELNATLEGRLLTIHRDVNIGLAVDATDGLIVPVVRGTHNLTLRSLASITRSLASKARDNTLGPDDLQAGTFTVTTLGQLGVDFFTPIINPPQVAILGIGRVFDKLVMVNSRVEERSAMYLNLSFDHRAVDGAPAARFLNTVKRFIELPVSLVTA